MTATLQEAIAAGREGDTERALLLAAEVAEADPQDANAWYLLSQLVDSDARRAAYLSKALAIDPTHARAREEFTALPPALAESLGASGVMAVPQTTLPAVESVLEPPPAEAPGDISVAPVAADVSAVPEWLRPLGAEAVEAKPVPPAYELAPAPPPAPARPAPKPRKAPPPPPRKRGNQALSFLLILLALLTVVVLVFLAYLLLA